jgi:hypothetical protein
MKVTVRSGLIETFPATADLEASFAFLWKEGLGIKDAERLKPWETGPKGAASVSINPLPPSVNSPAAGCPVAVTN